MQIPLSTYRLQFNSSFGFKQAKAIVTYLSELGVSTVYASPIFKPRKGSPHGYDVVDPNQINPELGTAEDFEQLMAEVRRHGLVWLQDVVPNHMAYDGENHMLMNVLENGRNSEYFDFFDIEWNHSYEILRGRLLAPFLGGFYGECLENGEIQLRYDHTGFTINYYALKFPLKIESYVSVLTHGLNTLKGQLGRDHPDFIKLLGILYVLKNLSSIEGINERYDQIKFAKRILWELYTRNQQIKRFIDHNIEVINGQKGNPDSFNLLDALLSDQLFSLSYWRVATQEVDYRRFFSINDLISLRMEDDLVFERTHALIFKLFNEGKINGLRIDHIDGLYDPTKYLLKLKEKTNDTYVIVEKILDLKERLPSIWPAQGTTGYDFLNYLNGIYCHTGHEEAFDEIYTGFTGFETAYHDLWYRKKKLIIERQMTGDINNLAHLLKRTLSTDRYGRDITLYALRYAIIEVMALFPVYRTYVSYEALGETDRLYIREAVRRAKEKRPSLSHELDFIERVLLLEFRDYFTDEYKKDWIHFVMRFQQFTGPLMAKGFEDTTLYVYNRLLSLNEVGGRPNRFGISVDALHAFNKERARSWPHTLNATSTHDTKRGEDVRARINVLSEIPREWESHLKLWNKMNRKRKRMVAGANVPDRNYEYFLYQTLIGTFPFCEGKGKPVSSDFVDRIKKYIVKAVREAKLHSTWAKPNAEYEEAFLSFVDAILGPSEENLFLLEFVPFQQKVAYYGMFNSLSQTLIKITSPGVPDFYQGTELWDLNLVDPDNRRPVDLEMRTKFLREMKENEHDVATLIDELLSKKEDGRIKLFLIYKALRARRENEALFQRGDYIPLSVDGAFKDHVVAFARKYDRTWSITLAPRLLTQLVDEGDHPFGERVWSDTHVVLPDLAPSSWKDRITEQPVRGEKTLRIGDVFKRFPVALLINKEG